jgi:hypothetical protein
MTTIGGPGGIGGPKGPSGPDPGGGPEAADAASSIDETHVTADASIDPLRGAAVADPGAIDRLAADVAAGRLTRREAAGQLIDQLVEVTGGPALDPSQRAELRALLTDLVAHDPHLGGLIGRI